MTEAIESRQVITVAAGGVRLRGTYHKPRGEASDSSADPGERKRIGVIFLTWILPRAGNGDSAVYWAESLAKCGYLAFRFDLPGLGDSDGDLATPGIDVETGAYGSALSEIANQLVERFHLGAVIVAGNCAGAVTALYAAAANEWIKGLILLDPYFHTQQDSPAQKVLLHWHVRVIKLAGDRFAQSKPGDIAVKLLSRFRGIYHRLSQKPLLVRRKTLPSIANLPLIRCWKQLAARRVRMLVLRSPSSTPRIGEFDYLGFLQPSSNSDDRIIIKLIERATHAFAESHGKEAVRTNAAQWLSAYFPLTRCAETRDNRRHLPTITEGILGAVTNVH